jgi:hypothetical protein
MKIFALALALLTIAASSANAEPGDTWILGIHHIDNRPSFTTYTGAGYSGPQSSGHMDFVGNAYGRAIPTGSPDGVARVYWELSGNATNSGRRVPNTTRLYSLEFFGTTEPGHNGWQPVESQIRGLQGEMYPNEPLIPWVGQFSTNHQWIGSTGKDTGQWHVMDNDGEGGPQAPLSDSFNAPGDGTYMWLKAGAWIYGKWNFNFAIDRSWSALRLTQVTGPALEGDYNEDGIVDASDYVTWRTTGADGPEGYKAWRSNFGRTAQGMGGGFGNAAAVPEAASMVLLAIGVTCLAWLGAPRSRRK